MGPKRTWVCAPDVILFWPTCKRCIKRTPMYPRVKHRARNPADHKRDVWLLQFSIRSWRACERHALGSQLWPVSVRSHAQCRRIRAFASEQCTCIVAHVLHTHRHRHDWTDIRLVMCMTACSCVNVTMHTCMCVHGHVRICACM